MSYQNRIVLILSTLLFLIASDHSHAQDTGLRIDKNSVLGGLDGAQILLFENENDYARFRITNSLFNSSTNNRFWDIAGKIGPDNTGLEDRLNFYLNGVGDILSLRGVDNGRVGIGTIFPATTLHVVGDIRASSLAGTGDRKVVADANGTLKTESAVPKYLTLSGAAFHPDSDNNSISWIAYAAGAFFSSAPAGFTSMIAPVFLPHDAVVTNVTVYYTDNDAANDVNFRLGRFILAANSFGSAGADLSSSGSPGYSSVFLSTSITIDNQLNAYYFVMYPNSSGTMDIDFQINAVIIEYVE
ncbi:MAG: hypothetical protein OEM26_09475 [Saprospiraceae bacterium]|nr:hypothetical protein [Saprospiraceae bacterium]